MPAIARVSQLARVTPSSIGDLECSYRHYQLRVKKAWPKRPMIATVARGVAVHEVLRLAYHHRVGDQPCVDHLEAWARVATWRGRWPEGTDKGAETQKVIAVVCALIGNDADDPEAVEGIIDLELQLEHPLVHEGEAIGLWSCKLDQVLYRKSEPTTLVVREFKTTTPRIDLRECYLQLSLAKRKYAHRGFEHYRIEFLWVGEDNRVTMEIVRDTDLKGVHAVVREAAIRVLTDQEHRTTTGEGCIFCPLRDTCPSQKAEGE